MAATIALGLSTTTLLAQTPPSPAAGTPPATATTEEKKESTTEETKAPTTDEKVAALEPKVADVMQYFNNLAPAGPLSGIAGPGHNAFIMVCAALVLFMTLPGLALFYGGLVRKKNVLSVLAQCLGCACMVTILWYFVGYSLVFGEHLKPADGPDTWVAPKWAPYFGSLKYMFLEGVSGAPNVNYTGWPSQATFSMFQLMFAIITPALIVGAIAERMKFTAIMAFIFFWMFLVYFPLAHMVWGYDGLLNGVWNGSAGIPSLDFAGGTVVHMSSGWSALVLCILLGKRTGFGKDNMAPHSMVLCMVGTGMLWVGWYGFNAGSALAADGIAASAFMTTTLAAATAGFVWGLAEKLHKGKVSILGLCSGIVAGLVVITPACGFVTAKSAMIIGVLAGVVPYFAVVFLKAKLGYDDALDTFGIHGVGGTMGAILTGVLADNKVNGNLLAANNAFVKPVADKGNGLADLIGTSGIIMNQIYACLITIAIAVVATVIITFVVKAIFGLRPTVEEETAGLDLIEHGEEGYIL
jgi:Amt family ammonium transporter